MKYFILPSLIAACFFYLGFEASKRYFQKKHQESYLQGYNDGERSGFRDGWQRCDFKWKTGGTSL